MLRNSHSVGPTGETDQAARRVRRICLLTAAVLGVLFTWAARPQMGPDGIAYLDLADAYLRRDWTHAFNTLWSPLYPAILALAFRIVRPAPPWEVAEVYLVNLLVYLAALASFDFLLRQLLGYQRRPSRAARSFEDGPASDWALPVVGYALFTFSSLQLIRLPATTPDLLMSVFVYLSAALVLKIARHPGRLWTFPLLGVSLGVGFWAKAPMLPVALAFLAAAALHTYPSIRAGAASLRVLAAAAAFALVSGALAVAYYETRGRLTLGDSGRLNYAWLINGLPYAHWHGGAPGLGRPVHPTRRVMAHPPVYEFASPLKGTYPPWLDPAYWNEGVRPRLDLRAHVRAAMTNTRFVLYDIVFGRQSAILTAALALAYLRRRRRRLPADLWTFNMLGLPAVGAIAMFSLIRVEARFIGAFVALAWLAVFAALTASPFADHKRAREAILVAAALGLILPSVAALALDVARNPKLGGGVHPQWEIAQALHQAGIKPGDRIAVIGWGLGAYWARLAGVTIVAEICAERPSPPWLCAGGPDGIREFWALPPAGRQRVYDAFRKAGATAVVATSLRGTELVVVDAAPTDGWQAISSPDFYVHTLAGAAAQVGHPPVPARRRPLDITPPR